MAHDDRLAAVLVQFAHTLVEGYEVADILYQLCDHVVEILPVTGAGVMLEDTEGVLRFVAASDEIVRAIEALQIELGEGPCLLAYRTGEQVIASDLEATELFPSFAKAALKAGMHAVYSFPMELGGQRIGALNLYRDEPDGFGDRDSQVGQVLADVATMYVANARGREESHRLNEQLTRALESRVVIEQAKGRIAEQLDTDVGDAFQVLRRHARNQGLRLSDVARAVVNGDLRFDRELA